MSEKREVIVFDDGSINAALIQYELKNNKDYDFEVDVIKVDPKDPVVEWFTKADPKDAKRIYLPFDTEDLVADKEKIRNEVNKAKAVGFENLIVLPYDGQDKKALKYRARSRKVTDREFNVIKPQTDPKPYITIKTDDIKDEESKSDKSKFRKKFV